jgi:hypothetical protein
MARWPRKVSLGPNYYEMCTCGAEYERREVNAGMYGKERCLW